MTNDDNEIDLAKFDEASSSINDGDEDLNFIFMRQVESDEDEL